MIPKIMIGWMVILVFNNVLKNIQILSQVGSDNLCRSVQSKELLILMKKYCPALVIQNHLFTHYFYLDFSRREFVSNYSGFASNWHRNNSSIPQVAPTLSHSQP